MVERKQRKTTSLWLMVGLAVYLCLVTLPATEGFIAFDHQRLLSERIKRKLNNLIRRVHKEQWVIGYRYADNCPPAARNNGKAIEEAITTALRAWLKPVRELNTGKPVVDDFRFVPDFEIKDVADRQLYDLTSVFFCDFGKSHAWVVADEAKPPHIELHRGTVVDRSFTGVLLHEIGHAFGLLDTYIRLELTLEELRVSRGGLAKTIGHQPASVMSGLNIPPPRGTRISQDDANGIVWLYKFYHENLALEDCIFPDYELEQSPDGCRPKSPLIFELKHGGEGTAFAVIRDDENTDVNAKDGNGMTALHYAVIKGYSQLVDKLLAHQDIEVNSKDGGGLTALHYAVSQRNESAVKRLLAHEGIDINIKDGSGLTALHHAVKAYPDSLDRLLFHEAIEVNSQDGDGLTALHYAVLQGSTRTVKALLAHEGIDIEVKDEKGRTALALANELKYEELANLISPPPPVKEEKKMSVKPKGKLTTIWGRLKQID